MFNNRDMRRFLVVTEEADDLQLLTIEQMRTLAGVTGSSQDAVLQARGLTVASNIMTECKIAIGNGAEPTLWQETLTETFECVYANTIFLSRRHKVEIVSVTVDDVLLDSANYRVNEESAELERLSSSGRRIHWCAARMVVVYKAGFEDLPAVLVSAASDYFRAIMLEQGRDPYVKSESVDIVGVETRRTELWTGNLPGSADVDIVPSIVASQLRRFCNFSMVG